MAPRSTPAAPPARLNRASSAQGVWATPLRPRPPSWLLPLPHTRTHTRAHSHTRSYTRILTHAHPRTLTAHTRAHFSGTRAPSHVTAAQQVVVEPAADVTRESQLNTYKATCSNEDPSKYCLFRKSVVWSPGTNRLLGSTKGTARVRAGAAIDGRVTVSHSAEQARVPVPWGRWVSTWALGAAGSRGL